MYNSYMYKLRNYETKHESKGYISPGTLRNGKVFEKAKCLSMYTPLTSC